MRSFLMYLKETIEDRPIFWVSPSGDPGQRGWDIREAKKKPDGTWDERFVVFRGDLSPQPTRAAAVRAVRREVPNARIRFE